MSIMAIMLAMQLFGADAQECKVQYRLMESETWFLLDDSGIDDHTPREVQYGAGESA